MATGHLVVFFPAVSPPNTVLLRSEVSVAPSVPCSEGLAFSEHRSLKLEEGKKWGWGLQNHLDSKNTNPLFTFIKCPTNSTLGKSTKTASWVLCPR